MKVSLVIPVYNEEKYIKECLISVVAQRKQPDEIIIVDNNSTDRTLKIASQFPVKIVKEKTQGMIQARNRGFNEAFGDIIARCDADVILPPDWVERIKDNFETRKIDALTGPCNYYDLKLKTVFLSSLYMDIVKPILNGNEVLLGPNMILTKNIWNKVKHSVCLNNKKVHEDIDLAIHIIDVGGRIERDEKLIIEMSGRRIKQNPVSFFGEYPLRVMKTLYYHKKSLIAPFLVP